MEKWEIISKYSSVQAVDDGVLLDLSILPLTPKNGLFSYVTRNLLSKGYFNEDGSINLPNILDLLNQAVQIVKCACVQDWFYSGVVELPNGMSQKIFIEQNETGRFTLLLPEDH